MRFGLHVGIAKKFATTVEEATAAGCDAIQIFSGNPRSFAIGPYDAAAWEGFRQRRLAADIRPTVIHTSYLVNMATENESLRRNGIALVANDMAVAARAGIEFVNTHLGSYGDADRGDGLKRVCAAIAEIIQDAPAGPMLLLENSAGAGRLCGGSMEELGAILAAVDSSRVGVCLDTAHAWASGYDVSSKTGVRHFMTLVDEQIGLGRVRALHLNDTEVPLGGKRDRHWHIGRGLIGLDGFAALLRTEALIECVCICETPASAEMDIENMRVVRELAHGGPRTTS